jgi:hypothetical protein
MTRTVLTERASAETIGQARPLGRSARVLVAPGTIKALVGAAVIVFVILLGVAGPFLALCFVAGAVAFWHGLVEYRNRLTILNLPTATACSAAIGLAELSGRARGAHVTPAAITGRPSVYWRAVVWRQPQNHGPHTKERPQVLIRTSPPLEFELEDDTGRILIWPHGAEFVLPTERWKSENGPPPDAGVRLLAEAGMQWPDPKDPRPMVMTETRLEEGGPLYVLGTLSERARIRATPTRDGGERELASRPFQAWAEQVSDAPLPAVSVPPDVDDSRVVVWKGDQGRPFILADSERDAVKRLSRSTWIEILCGAAFMTGSLAFAIAKIMGR